MSALTAVRLRELLHYCPSDGTFTWCVTRGGRAQAGTPAGTYDTHGYLQIRVDGPLYLAHRLAWLWMTNEWPTGAIDHANRNTRDNRWANLRQATHGQNVANRVRKRGIHNLPPGVTLDKRWGRYVARVQRDGHRTVVGRFASAGEASAARDAAARLIHGEFFPA